MRQQIERTAGGLVSVEDVLVVPPVRLTTRPGFDTESFAFTTDIPLLDRWGAPLLLGPDPSQSPTPADEYVEIAELHRAVIHERLARELLRRAAMRRPDSLKSSCSTVSASGGDSRIQTDPCAGFIVMPVLFGLHSKQAYERGARTPALPAVRFQSGAHRATPIRSSHVTARTIES